MPLGVHSGSVPTLLASAIFSNGDNVLILSIAVKKSSHKGFVPLIPVPSLQGLSLPTPQVIGDAFTGGPSLKYFSRISGTLGCRVSSIY
jgi:hypothetical protein